MKRIRSVQRSQLYNYYSQSYIWLEFFFFKFIPTAEQRRIVLLQFPLLYHLHLGEKFHTQRCRVAVSESAVDGAFPRGGDGGGGRSLGI